MSLKMLLTQRRLTITTELSIRLFNRTFYLLLQMTKEKKLWVQSYFLQPSSSLLELHNRQTRVNRKLHSYKIEAVNQRFTVIGLSLTKIL